MNMMYTALIGLTLILVRGTIFESLRRIWPAFFGCSQCVGTWIGAAAGAAGLVAFGHGRVLDAILTGAAVSVLSIAADAILLRLLGDPQS